MASSKCDQFVPPLLCTMYIDFQIVQIGDLLSLKQDQIPEPVVKKVEFRLLLYLACQEAPQNVIQVININSKLYWTGN